MKNKGFTLVEMLVSIAIFAIFMGILMTSYISLVKGFRGTEDYRILYADARHVFDTILENARNSTVYDCSDNGDLNRDLTVLSFCSTDGVKQVTFVYTEPVLGADGKVLELGTIDMAVDDGLSTLLNTEGINISEFSFKVFPKEDPFSSGSEAYQPIVIVDATFEKESASGTIYKMPLHTAISLRTYH